jgi:hypothetical protein
MTAIRSIDENPDSAVAAGVKAIRAAPSPSSE